MDYVLFCWKPQVKRMPHCKLFLPLYFNCSFLSNSQQLQGWDSLGWQGCCCKVMLTIVGHVTFCGCYTAQLELPDHVICCSRVKNCTCVPDEFHGRHERGVHYKFIIHENNFVTLFMCSWVATLATHNSGSWT